MNLNDAERLYAAKAAAELGDAEALAPGPIRGWRGEPGARLAFVIGRPSEEDRAAGEILRGATGEAAGKAAEALGVALGAFFALATRPVEGLDASASTDRVGLALEAADPAVVIALDANAAQDVANAYSIAVPGAGVPVRVRGRIFGYAGDLGASLSDARAKAKVWGAMRTIAAEGGLKATGRHQGAPK